MKRIPVFVLVFLFAVFAVAGNPVRENVIDPAVVVSNEAGLGTGSLIDVGEEKLVLTASHVVAEAYKDKKKDYKNDKGETISRAVTEPTDLTLEFRDGRQMKGRPVWYSPDWQAGSIDLALVKPLGSLAGLKTAVLTSAVLEEGEDVFYCGTGGGIKWSLERSIVNQFNDRHLMSNGIGWYGHSGSGMYVKREGQWRLVAVLTQFVQTPDNNLRSPMQGELGIRKFLDDYLANKTKKPAVSGKMPKAE